MATHDYVIANGTGSAVRSDLNNALAAIVSNNSSSTEPATKYAYQWWADTNANVLKIRNSANNAWISVRELDGTTLMADGSAAEPGLAFAADVNTGFFSGGADKINFATGGVERLEIGSSEVVFNDGSNDVDFRVESNGQTHMLFVNGGNDRVGIGTASPDATVHVEATDASLLLSNSGRSQYFRIQNNETNDALTINANDTSERLRIDSSGRLLVGTSSDQSESDANAKVQIFTSTAGKLILGREDSSVAADDFIGIIDFRSTDGGSQKVARIACQASGAHAANDKPGSLVFSTTAGSASSPTERMKIGSDGLVATHMTSTSGLVLGTVGNATNYTIIKGKSSSSGINTGNDVFYVYGNGNVQNSNNSYGQISDQKLKENIVDANSQWNNIKDVRVRNFNFIEGQTHTQIGVVAQELEAVSPGLVDEAPDRDEDGNDLGTVTKSVKYSVLYMKAVKALQEAMDRIETLETKVAALEAG